MKFGAVPVAEVAGSVLAHGLKRGGLSFRKGRLLSVADVQALQAEGVTEVIVAQLAGDDVPEDVAAQALADALCGAGAHVTQANTGRANLLADAQGLAVVDAARIHAINAVHESLTVATVPPFEPIGTGQMLATIKIIPYAVPRAALQQALALAAGAAPALGVAAFASRRVALAMTRLADTRAPVLAKMRDAVAKRLQPLGSPLQCEAVVRHEVQALADVLRAWTSGDAADVLLISGIAATVDRADVVPAAIEAAGGQVLHAGMPVDPGNLLVLGQLLGRPVVGLPTCARSPKLNGFDFVLRRLVAGLPVDAAQIMQMGVGGLLTEIPTRPMPRG
jgi:molybdenum cofactor cytidylyltransferase